MKKEKIEPIKSHKEFDQVLDAMAELAAKKFNIPLAAARMRIMALKRSKVLDQFEDPSDPVFQYLTDMCLQIPQIQFEENIN